MTTNPLDVLVEKPLSRIGRAADMLWLQFGTLHATPTQGGTKWVGEWALHVQTSWRFVKTSTILLAVADLYVTPDGDDYDWGTGGDSNFDIYTERFNAVISDSPPMVERVMQDTVGGFEISFSDDTRFDVFTKESGMFEPCEQWRLFQPNVELKHTVCEISNGIMEIG